MEQTDLAGTLPQLALYFGRVQDEDATNPARIERFLNECSMCGLHVIAFGRHNNTQNWLQKLAFSCSASVVWLQSQSDSATPIAGLPTLVVPGDTTTLINLVSSSTTATVTLGGIEAAYEGLIRSRLVSLEKLNISNAQSAHFPVLSAIFAQFPSIFAAINADAALKSGYELLWHGYPSSNDDASTTWDAVAMFRRSLLASCSDQKLQKLTEEALVRSSEAAGSYYYYQCGDYAEALRYFVRSVSQSDPKTPLGRFMRALATETQGLLAFDLGNYLIAESAALQAREMYIVSREDSRPEVRFYFDHTIEGLSGDAAVYRAYHLAEIGEVSKALDLLSKGRTAYQIALEIQPRWKTNLTCDTYLRAMQAIIGLEEKLIVPD